VHTPETLGGRVAQARRQKAVREHRDIRQIDVAKAIQVSGATISDCEADKKVPSEPILAALAAYLDTTPAYLRYGLESAAPLPNGSPVSSVIAAPDREEGGRAFAARAHKKTAAQKKSGRKGKGA
jgi:transcriptional regulator with XRE-family HTH domain